MNLLIKKEAGVFKNSLLPAEAQIGLVNEIQDKLKRAVESDLPERPFLYLAVSNFSYRGSDVLNSPFDFSAEKPTEIDTGIDLFGPMLESLAGAVAFGFQEAFILAHQRFREGDREQLLYLAHLGDGGYHLCEQIGIFSHLTQQAQSADKLKSVIEIASNTARITYTSQIRDARERLSGQEWDREINDRLFADEQQRILAAAEHLRGVDQGQALLMEALNTFWLKSLK
ncbi:hypothetical protein HZB78_00225 [Candidatus Collierbacteria bacterium]|nr:hypothetical protein [Candidatus Collierbacteria bacterium]